MRRLAVAVAVLFGVLLLLDRGAALLAERVVAARAQESGRLAQRPSVDVQGFPFLTQALRGRYDRVRVVASGDVGGQGRVERLDARVRGVRLPLGDVVGGEVSALPVDGLTADLVLSYDELARRSGRDVALGAERDLLVVTTELEVLGSRVRVSALSRVRVEGGAVVVRAQEFRVGDGSADALLSAALGDRLDLTIPVGELPYGLALTGLAVRPDGLHLTASGGPTVLGP